MKDRIKAWAQLARKSVWVVLLLAYPYADQIIASIEGWLPALAPYMGAHTFRYVSVLIVAAKVALQVYRGLGQFKALLAAQQGGQANG